MGVKSIATVLYDKEVFMKKRRILRLFLIVAIIATMVSVTAFAEESKVFKFGVLAPLTGTNAEYGYGFQVAVDLAVKEINEAGGVAGYTLEYELEDSAGDPVQSADLARKFCEDDDIMAILGDYTSGCCMACAPIVDEFECLLLSPSASSLDYPPMSKYCFATVGRTTDEVKYFCTGIVKGYFGGKTLGIIYINSDYGTINAQYIQDQAEIDGVDIVAQESFLDGETDFSAIISKVRAADPDVVMLIDTGNIDKIVNQIAKTDWDPKLAILGPSTSVQLIENCGENIEGATTTTPFFYDESNKPLMDWLKSFEDVAGYAPTLHIPGMRDAVYQLAQCIQMCVDDGLEVNRNNLRDKMEIMEMDGLCGHIKYNEDGAVQKTYYIFEVIDGDWVIVVDRPEM